MILYNYLRCSILKSLSNIGCCRFPAKPCSVTICLTCHSILPRGLASSSAKPCRIRFYVAACTVAISGVAALVCLCMKCRSARKYKDKDFYFDKHIKGNRDGMYQLKGVWISPLCIKNETHWQTLRNMKVHEQDIFVISFPKSGTTWLQEIVYLVQSNLNFASAQSKHLEDRFSYLEYVYPGLNAIIKMKPPRLLKSHLPLSLLPDQLFNGKVFYIARNPRDVAVSYFHFWKSLTMVDYDGSFEDFFELFKQGKTFFGSWWTHVKQFWMLKNEQRLLVLSYEELQQNPCATVKKIATFLHKDLSDSEIRRIVSYCSFENMQENSSVNYSWMENVGLMKKSTKFMRKGIIGDWKNYFTCEMAQEFDRITQEEELETVGLLFSDDHNE